MITAADGDGSARSPSARGSPEPARTAAPRTTRTSRRSHTCWLRPAAHRPQGEAVPSAGEEPDRLQEEDLVGATPSSAPISLTEGSAECRAVTIRSSSTCSAASTPAWRPPASASGEPWACGTSPSKGWQVNCGVIAANIDACRFTAASPHLTTNPASTGRLIPVT
jgi:hypothetical protein